MYIDGTDRHGVSRTLFLPNTIWKVKLIVDCGPIEMLIMTETVFENDDDDKMCLPFIGPPWPAFFLTFSLSDLFSFLTLRATSHWLFTFIWLPLYRVSSVLVFLIDYFWVSQGKKPIRNKNTAVNNYVCKIVHWMSGCCQFTESFPITRSISNLETIKWLREPRSTKLLWKLLLTMISQ